MWIVCPYEPYQNSVWVNIPQKTVFTSCCSWTLNYDKDSLNLEYSWQHQLKKFVVSGTNDGCVLMFLAIMNQLCTNILLSWTLAAQHHQRCIRDFRMERLTEFWIYHRGDKWVFGFLCGEQPPYLCVPVWLIRLLVDPVLV